MAIIGTVTKRPLDDLSYSADFTGDLTDSATLASDATTYVIARYAQYATTLAAALAADATTVVLTVGLAFEEGDEIHVGAEQITLGPKDGDTFTGCTRHVNGTAAAAHLAGDLVYRATTVDLCDAERTVATPVVTQNLAGGLDGEQHLVIYVATASTGFVYQHELLVSIREP